MKQSSDDILERHIVYSHPINQSYENHIKQEKNK